MTHSYEVFTTAREYGWTEELGFRSMNGHQFVTYRKGDWTINIQGGNEGRIVWCTFLHHGKLLAHLTSRDKDKAGCIVAKMKRSDILDHRTQLDRIREFCDSITSDTLWEPSDLALEVRDFIDGYYTGNVIAP